MSKTLQGTGKYKAPDGSEVNYEFEYEVFDSVQDAVESLGEAETLKKIQRMVKVDSNNTARERAKTANGHSSRKPLTEEEKQARKAKRAEERALLDKVKNLSPEQLDQLLANA